MHRRHQLRLPQYDYSSAGAYFVTICAHQRRKIFGEIAGEEMKLNGMGEIVRSVWKELPMHYEQMDCDEFVVMPNHIHAIVALTDIPVGAGFKPAPAHGTWDDGSNPAGMYAGGRVLNRAPTRHGLPEIVRALKTFSARQINDFRGTPGVPVWQSNYYEHVIRNETDLSRIRQYILENPQKWALDSENTDHVNIG